MKEFPEAEKKQTPEVTSDSLKAAYTLLGTQSPLELSNLYSAEDQKLMSAGEWDYNNPNLVVNKVKTILEAVNPNNLSEDENEWRQEILWFWYHHAISCAIWRYNDRVAAQLYSEQALQHQPEHHPNKITRLLYYLTRDEVQEAEQWATTIAEEPEKTTSGQLLEDYKAGHFFVQAYSE